MGLEKRVRLTLLEEFLVLLLEILTVPSATGNMKLPPFHWR